ncbi:recombinase family protein [Aeromonas hydrophila]|uniref:recombinase family protein n=1 Tax=Aeromonas hydrophila TaxID=644 RepID=UPI003EC7BC0E
MKSKAWLYARFSSSQQADGDSINRQQKAAEAWCKSNGVELQQTSFHDLGVSGWKSIKRPMFEQLIKAMQEGKIPSGSYVLFESTDRLSRRGWEHTRELIKQITIKHGCKLVILDKNQVYTKDNVNDVVQNILLMFSADLAEKESQRKSDLVAAAYKSKRQKGDVSRWPFWLDKKNDKFVFNEKAEIIKLIVDLRLKGVGALGIAAELNRQGHKSSRGSNWGHTSVRIAIENSALYGTKDFFTTKSKKETDDDGNEIRTSDKELVSSMSDAFPAICDFDTWKKIQINGEKPGRKSNGTAFHNMIFCSCGAAMGIQIGSGGEKYRKCSKAKVGACNQKMIRNFDQTLVECLGRITYKSVINQTANRIPELTERLAKLEKVKAMLIEVGDVDSLKDAYRDITAVKNEIATESKVVSVPTTVIKDVFQLSIDEQRLLLKQLIGKVIVDRTNNLCKIKVMLTNGHKRVFGVNVGTGKKSGQNTIAFETDTEKFSKELQTLSED